MFHLDLAAAALVLFVPRGSLANRKPSKLKQLPAAVGECEGEGRTCGGRQRRAERAQRRRRDDLWAPDLLCLAVIEVGERPASGKCHRDDVLKEAPVTRRNGCARWQGSSSCAAPAGNQRLHDRNLVGGGCCVVPTGSPNGQAPR
ncbi:hypothetical protein PR202_gb22297 [Eleusine coracana subsp. coracana]|uniref:Secreted protein n=1 Tax=Eleusine coracana subsp. coracana TaxID=191504 RepID=A0AAV5FHC8_ELECO|nr:hypothetical protein PR202_gb22297 [Eleusine coracana subsp. coracana]